MRSKLVVVGVLVAAGVVVFAGPASAQATYSDFTAEIAVDPDGTFQVTETIDVEFSIPRHGIFRDMPEKYTYDNEHLRDTDIDVLSVTRDGSREPYEILHLGSQNETLRLKVGDADTKIQGTHQYVVEYRVDGAFNSFPDHEELYWNALGSYWESSFERATVTVGGPEIVRWACWAGPTYSTQPCEEIEAGPQGVTYAANSVGSSSDMTVVVGFPRGSVAVPGPQLEEIWKAEKAFAFTGPNVGLGLGLAAALGWLLTWLLIRGRDERGTAGLHETDAGDLLPGTVDVDPDDAPVQFRPPKGLKPAHLGLIDDERVDPVDVGATIVDLAVRGHLLIEDRRTPGEDDPDWVLTLRSGANPDDELAPFENRLLEGLEECAGSNEVSLDDIKGEFHTEFERVANMLYQESVDRKWFRRRPDKVRMVYLLLSFLLLGAAIAVVVLAMSLRWKIGLATVPLGLAFLVMLVGHRRMPAKTARGRATLIYARGFKKFIETAEKPEMNYAVDKGEFLRYLPYAVAFDAVEAWSRATKGLDVAAATAGWYAGPAFTNFGSFGSDFSSFASTVGSGLASAPASSGSSGFSSGGGSSGGGMGGGGGGSW